MTVEELNSIPENGYKKIDSKWYVRPPGMYFAGSIENHDVKENPDGTITVHPSILYSGYDPNKKDMVTYHGWLVNGLWKEA